MKYAHARLLVFSKAPVPGQVKTRLIPLLGAVKAARLYADMLEDTLRKAVAGELCPIELWCTPSINHAFFAHCHAHYPVRLQRQVKGDLGQRMSQALHSALQEAHHAVLIGADCPALGSADIEAAIEALATGADVVLVPATDGGYCLIGMSGHYPYLFDNIAWSTPQVLETTLAHCRARGLKWVCLPACADVDTPEDYRDYCTGRPARQPLDSGIFSQKIK